MNWKERKANAAQRKRRLGERINDNAKLIAAIRFYLACLLPERRADAFQVFGRCKDLRDAWKGHLEAARRILGVMTKGQTLTLPKNWRFRLERVGFEIFDYYGIRQEFQGLNTDLILDDAIKAYSTFHPILNQAKAFLCGGEWPPRPEPPRLGVYDQHLQAYIQGGLRELLFEREL